MATVIKLEICIVSLLAMCALQIVPLVAEIIMQETFTL